MTPGVEAAGGEDYATALRANTTTTMSPDDIHQLGTELFVAER